MTEISRRKFIQLSVVGSAVAASGCRPLSRYSPGLYRAEVTGQYGGYDNRVYPYLNQPDGLQDGVPQYFATVCQMCPAGCGLLVRTISGRAVKIEGNPAHPVSQGASCARGQAALQHLYNPDRLRRPVSHTKRGQTFTRDRDKDANPPDGREKITEVTAEATDWETALNRVAQSFQSASGRVAILADAQEFGYSPTQRKRLDEFAAAAGASVFTYSLLDDAPWRAAARAIYGRDQIPAYQLDQANFVVSFGGDFLEAWPSPVYYNRLFGEFRQGPRRAQGEHGRFVYIGPRMSMTAAKADVWLPCNPGTEAVVAAAVRAALAEADVSLTQAVSVSGLTEAQIRNIADEMRRAGPRAVAVPGNGLMTSASATAAFTAVEALNVQVGSQCVGFGTAALASAAPQAGQTGFQGILRLVQAMQAGQVGALLVIGQPNPVFTLPPAAGFTDALEKVPFVAALTAFEDETTAYADVVLPTRTFLEDWGDYIPPVIPPGTRMATLRQPIIDPQFVGGHGQVQKDVFQPWMDTRPLGDLITDIANRLGKKLTDTDSRAAVRRAWAGIGQADLAADTTENDTPWVGALAGGGVWSPPTPNNKGAKSAGARFIAPPVPTPAPLGAGVFALQLYPSIYNHDGRHANLGWMQENPDPMTMAVWNSWVEINMQVAHSLGIRTGDIVRISSPGGRHIEVPAVPYPGIHPQAIAMPIGQGHTVYGRNAAGRGTNPLVLLDATADAQTGALAYSAATVTLKKIADAQSGYDPHGSTLVLAQDRPGGGEPDAVKNLIHTTAKEWKKAPAQVKGAPQAEGSMFKRAPGTVDNPGEPGAAE